MRSAASAKSIIMMAFFFTIPMSRTMPIKAITLKSLPEEDESQQGADAR